MSDRVTRVAADLMESATAEGARQSRSAKQQLDHWARVGRAVSSHQTASRHRVEAAMAGAIEESLAGTNYGDVLSARGITLVALNDDGELIEYWPDGSSSVMGAD